jgi:VWFA-related protein
MEGASVPRRAAVLVVSVALAALVLSVHAQQDPQSPRSIFRVRTDLIPVDVSVLDKDRQPVRGLSSADFAVYEDGKRRPVVAFSAVDVPVPVRDAAVAPWVRDAPKDVVSNDLPDEGRLVVILMDGTIPDGQPTIAAKQIAHEAVDELGPGDLAAVVRSTIFGNNGLSQGFTSDRSRLIDAIDSPFMGTTEPPEMTAAGLESPSPVPGTAFHTKEQCEVLYDVARAMRDAPRRRKMVIFVGTSLGLGGQLRSGGDIRPCREKLLGELADSNVTVQAVDPVGLLTLAVGADYTTHNRVTPELQQRWGRQNQNRIDALRVLPSLTGGRLVANTNTPQNAMPAIFAESQSYYLLGFEPASPVTKNAHAIRVEVRRRGVTVHWRNGYRTQPEVNAVAVRAENGAASAVPPELTAALDGALPRQDLPLSVTVAPFALAVGRKAAVAIALGATLPAGADARTLDVTVGAFDVRGNAVGVGHQTIDVPIELARTGRADDGLITRLDLPPGRYELRAAVQDVASGTIGSVFSFVDVPDFGRDALTMSGLVLHREESPHVEDNPIAGVVPIIPTVARAFSRDDGVHAFLRIYQSSDPQSVTVTTRVIDATNRAVVEQQTELSVDAFLARSADVDVPLPLSQLEPGHYLLTIAAARGELHVERTARFEVRAAR